MIILAEHRAAPPATCTRVSYRPRRVYHPGGSRPRTPFASAFPSSASDYSPPASVRGAVPLRQDGSPFPLSMLMDTEDLPQFEAMPVWDDPEYVRSKRRTRREALMQDLDKCTGDPLEDSGGERDAAGDMLVLRLWEQCTRAQYVLSRGGRGATAACTDGRLFFCSPTDFLNYVDDTVAANIALIQECVDMGADAEWNYFFVSPPTPCDSSGSRSPDTARLGSPCFALSPLGSPESPVRSYRSQPSGPPSIFLPGLPVLVRNTSEPADATSGFINENDTGGLFGGMRHRPRGASLETLQNMSKMLDSRLKNKNIPMGRWEEKD